MKRLLTFLGLSTLLLSCNLGQQVADTSIHKIQGRNWVLNYFAGEPLPPNAGLVNINFNQTNFSGNTMCNIVNGTYYIGESRLVLSNITQTERACIDDNGNAFDTKYLNTLRQVNQWQINGSTLELYINKTVYLKYYEKK